MSSNEGTQKPSAGLSWIVIGAILLILGLVGIVTFIVGATMPTTGDEHGSSVWQTLSVVLGAVFFGVGLVSIINGFIKRRK